MTPTALIPSLVNAGRRWRVRARRRRPGERRVFTDYVRALASPGGRQQAEELLPEVWSALRAAAASELRRRGLWLVPPVYLGFTGWSAWELADGGDGALDELVGACFEASFVTRLSTLARHLEVKDNIDGLVFLNIRHLLHDLQLRHDPVGARVFEVLRVAVRTLTDEGSAEVLKGSPEVLNDTVLGLAPDVEAVAPAAASELEARVAAWSDELLPELLTARGEAARAAVAGELARRIRGLPAAGFAAVRVQDLIDPLRTAVRSRWAAILARSEERLGLDAETTGTGSGPDVDFGSLAHGYRPDVQAETWDSFRKLTDCVAQALENLRVRPATVGHLERMWQYLRLYALDHGQQLPSRRRLAALLDIPRNSMPDLYRILGRLVDACREALSGGRPVAEPGGGYALELGGTS